MQPPVPSVAVVLSFDPGVTVAYLSTLPFWAGGSRFQDLIPGLSLFYLFLPFWKNFTKKKKAHKKLCSVVKWHVFAASRASRPFSR